MRIATKNRGEVPAALSMSFLLGRLSSVSTLAHEQPASLASQSLLPAPEHALPHDSERRTGAHAGRRWIRATDDERAATQRGVNIDPSVKPPYRIATSSHRGYLAAPSEATARIATGVPGTGQ